MLVCALDGRCVIAVQWVWFTTAKVQLAEVNSGGPQTSFSGWAIFAFVTANKLPFVCKCVRVCREPIVWPVFRFLRGYLDVGVPLT